MQMGLTPSDLQRQLQTMTEGIQISSVFENEQIISIRMVYNTAYDLSIPEIEQARISLNDGSVVPLKNLAEIRLEKGIAEINRENQKSMGVISARLDDRDLGSTLKDIQKRLSREISLPPGYNIVYGGAYIEQQRAFNELLMILGGAILLVFSTILFLFRKISTAITIIILSVLGVAGCLVSLLITGTPLNVGSYMGIIMIVGIIGENSIFTYRQYIDNKADLSIEEKLEYAISTRLRPKLMTAFAAICALLPLSLGLGAGAQLHQPLAIAVIGGLIFALPLLLIVLPVLLKLIEKT